MHQWQLLMTFLSYNMTCYIVASTFKSTFKTLFFLVVELNLILYSPDIEVAKKDAAAFTEYCSKQVYLRLPNNRTNTNNFQLHMYSKIKMSNSILILSIQIGTKIFELIVLFL